MKPTTCPMDLIPSHLLKVFHAVGRSGLDIINESLISGVVLSFLKHAMVQLSLKKLSLEPDSPSNFRRISKLPFLMKILEKSVI